jgi:hypothetical protein
MADTKISALSAVATPASTDEIAVNQGAVSKKATWAQLKTFVNTAPVFAAGSTTANTHPEFTSGSLLTTAEAGAMEFVAPVLYASPANSCRASWPATMWASNTADFTMGNVATAQPWLAAANDTLTLPGGNATYFFEMLYAVEAMGATTRTTGMLFGGTATISAIRYKALIQTGAANALGTTQSTKMCAAATIQILNATATTAAEYITASGIIRVTTTGTLIPQIQWSANPTGTILCKAGSYFRIWAAGTDSAAAVGNWA